MQFLQAAKKQEQNVHRYFIVFNEVPVTLCNFIMKQVENINLSAKCFSWVSSLGDKIYGDDKKCQTDKFYLHALRLSVPQNPIQMPEIGSIASAGFSKFLELEMKYDFMMKL